MEQEIELGKRVQIVNYDASGEEFIEGTAVIRSIISRDENGARCLVVFDGDYYNAKNRFERRVRKETIEK